MAEFYKYVKKIAARLCIAAQTGGYLFGSRRGIKIRVAAQIVTNAG